MKFSDIPGHDSAKQRLRTMADSNRLPHALLISAPEGCGELMLARAFSQYIHCTDRTPDGEPCGHCPSCIQHQTFNHPDIHFSYPVIKRGEVTISADWLPEWRTFLTNDPWADPKVWQKSLGKPDSQPVIYVHEADEISRILSFTSHGSNLRIVLIWRPERFMEQTANKLLKLLEEPQPGSIFILVSNAPDKILPTIYSRCQRITLNRLPDATIASLLQSLCSVNPADAMALAHIAEGNFIAARTSVAAEGEFGLFLQLFMQLMRSAYARRVADLKLWSEKVADLGREGIRRFLIYCQRMVRENYILNLHYPDLCYLNSDEQAFSSRFCPFINERNVQQLIAEMEAARTDIEGNGNARIVLFDLAIKTIMLIIK